MNSKPSPIQLVLQLVVETKDFWALVTASAVVCMPTHSVSTHNSEPTEPNKCV